MEEQHRIESLRFILDTPEELNTHEVQNAVSRSFKSIIHQEINQILSEEAQGQFIQLPSLELNLGTLDFDHLEHQLAERTLMALRRQIRESIKLQPVPPSQEAPSTSLRIAIYLLENAATPWWAPAAKHSTLEQWLIRSMEDAPLAFLDYLSKHHQEPRIQARLDQVLTPQLKEKLLKLATKQPSKAHHKVVIQQLKQQWSSSLINELEELTHFLNHIPQSTYPNQIQNLIRNAEQSSSKLAVQKLLEQALSSAPSRRQLIARLSPQALEAIIHYLAPQQSRQLLQQTLAVEKLLSSQVSNHASHLRAVRIDLWDLSLERYLETTSTNQHSLALLTHLSQQQSINIHALRLAIKQDLESRATTFPSEVEQQLRTWLKLAPEDDLIHKPEAAQATIPSSVDDTPNKDHQTQIEQEKPLSTQQRLLLQQLFSFLSSSSFRPSSPRALQPHKLQTTIVQALQHSSVNFKSDAEWLGDIYRQIAAEHEIETGAFIAAIQRVAVTHGLAEPWKSAHTQVYQAHTKAAPKSNQNPAEDLLQHFMSPNAATEKLAKSLTPQEWGNLLEKPKLWQAFLSMPNSRQLLVLSQAAPRAKNHLEEFIPQLWPLKRQQLKHSQVTAPALQQALLRAALAHNESHQSEGQYRQQLFQAAAQQLKLSADEWNSQIQPHLERALDHHSSSVTSKSRNDVRSPIEQWKWLVAGSKNQRLASAPEIDRHLQAAIRTDPKAFQEHFIQHWGENPRLKSLTQQLSRESQQQIISNLAPQLSKLNLGFLDKLHEIEGAPSTFSNSSDWFQWAASILSSRHRQDHKAPNKKQWLGELAREISTKNSAPPKQQVLSILETKLMDQPATENLGSSGTRPADGTIPESSPDQTKAPDHSQSAGADADAMIELWAKVLERLWDTDPIKVIQHLGDAALTGTHAQHQLRSIPAALSKQLIQTLYPELAEELLEILSQLSDLLLATQPSGHSDRTAFDSELFYPILLALNSKQRTAHSVQSLTELTLHQLAKSQGSKISEYCQQLLDHGSISSLPPSLARALLAYGTGAPSTQPPKTQGSSFSESFHYLARFCATEAPVPDPSKWLLALQKLNSTERSQLLQRIQDNMENFLKHMAPLGSRAQWSTLAAFAPEQHAILKSLMQRVRALNPHRSEVSILHPLLQSGFSAGTAKPLTSQIVTLLGTLGFKKPNDIQQLLEATPTRPNTGDAILVYTLYQLLVDGRSEDPTPSSTLEYDSLDAFRADITSAANTPPEWFNSHQSTAAIARLHPVSEQNPGFIEDLRMIMIATLAAHQAPHFASLTLALLSPEDGETQTASSLATQWIDHLSAAQSSSSHDWIETHWATIQALSPYFENPSTLLHLHQSISEQLPTQPISLPELPGSVPSHFTPLPSDEPESSPFMAQDSNAPELVNQELDSEVWLIENAGIALFAPYIEMLFDRAELLENRAFPSTDHAIQAVFLLQHVITGEYSAHEPELLLNRIICNLPLEQPLPRSVEANEDWPELVSGLKSAIIHHWSTIGETTHEGLIETFVKRSGSLRYDQDDGWSLHVDPGPYDMLLESVPWAISKIHLPWMHQAIRVEWN